jgi:hypothetical protein
MGGLDLCNLFGSSNGDDPATTISAFGTKIDDVIHRLDDIQIVFDYEHRIPGVGQSLQYAEQAAHIFEMQASRRLIQDVERPPRGSLSEFGSEFHSLCFSAGKGWCRLAEAHISQSNVNQCLQLAGERGLIGKELRCLFDRHVEYLSDGLSFEMHFECFPVVASSAADFARHIDIRQKMHFDFDGSVTGTMFATPAFHVEGKSSWRISPNLRFLGCGKERSDLVKGSGIGRRI